MQPVVRSLGAEASLGSKRLMCDSFALLHALSRKRTSGGHGAMKFQRLLQDGSGEPTCDAPLARGFKNVKVW